TIALEDFAPLGGAVGGALRVGETLALAGVLALAGIVGALASALALAGVGAAAVDAFGKRGRGEGAGCEDRRRCNHEIALVHEEPPGCASVRSPPVIRADRPEGYGAHGKFV